MVNDPAVWIVLCLTAAWVAWAVGSAIFVRTRRTARDKQIAFRWTTLATILGLGAFLTALLGTWGGEGLWFLPILWALLGFVAWTNLRGTLFCPACGQKSVVRGRRPGFCPRCGAPLS